MAHKDSLLEVKTNMQFCLQKLQKCKTRQEIIAALEEISNLLMSLNLPVGAVTATSLQYARTADEASVMKVRDDVIERLRDYLSQSERALSKLESGEPAKPKSRRFWLIVILGFFAVVICVVVAVALFAVFMAKGGA
jgi:type VI protein secretion system component VasF